MFVLFANTIYSRVEINITGPEERLWWGEVVLWNQLGRTLSPQRLWGKNTALRCQIIALAPTA